MSRRSFRAFSGISLLSLSILLPMTGLAGDFHNPFPRRDDRPRMIPSSCHFGYYGTGWRVWPEGCDSCQRCEDPSRGIMQPALPIEPMSPVQPMTPVQPPSFQPPQIQPPPVQQPQIQPPPVQQPQVQQPQIQPMPEAMIPASPYWSNPPAPAFGPYSQSRYPQAFTPYPTHPSLPYQQALQFPATQIPAVPPSAPTRSAVPSYNAPVPSATPVPPPPQARNRFKPQWPMTMMPAPHKDVRGITPAAGSKNSLTTRSPSIIDQAGFVPSKPASPRNLSPVTLLRPE